MISGINPLKRAFNYLRHALAFAILAFFIISFFIGIKIDPSFIDIARSPYGLFTYFVICSITFFMPSLITLPIVTTATIIWGPWLAGSIAILGWTIRGLVEYYAAVFTVGSVKLLFSGVDLEKKMEMVRSSINFWQLSIARVFVPPFIFGLARTNINAFILSSFVAYLPLAALGVGSGEILRPYYEQIQPLILGAALVVLIFTLDWFFARREVKTQLPERY